METSTVIFETLYWISYALLYPVILLLMAFVVWSLALAGEFISEYTRRYRDVTGLDELCRKTDVSDLRKGKRPFFVSAFMRDLADQIERRYFNFDRMFGDYEIAMAKKLETTRLLATVGPMLGLMGTLIPLGPALMGLAEGNVEQLASNLVIAFATTVLGLFSGAVGFSLTMIRRRWYQQDINDIECILDAFLGKYAEK
ncbi:MAG: MotA/TolQ/ExbB proton channel family protein [ANME-2 cluster archaeon]|jgi:biopolymer transport protein ExbB/TolQ|nr:MAG: MotA/TolQ/ExbB proton channel family protein [ANME-2 cluster archaeon]